MQIFKLAALWAYLKTESANVQVLKLDKYKICNSAKRIISWAESTQCNSDQQIDTKIYMLTSIKLQLKMHDVQRQREKMF